MTAEFLICFIASISASFMMYAVFIYKFRIYITGPVSLNYIIYNVTMTIAVLGSFIAMVPVIVMKGQEVLGWGSCSGRIENTFTWKFEDTCDSMLAAFQIGCCFVTFALMVVMFGIVLNVCICACLCIYNLYYLSEEEYSDLEV